MTKIATIDVLVPDDVKNDDVFNFMRSHQWTGSLVGMTHNPNEPPLSEMVMPLKIIYKARGAEDASLIEDQIRSTLLGLKCIEGFEA